MTRHRAVEPVEESIATPAAVGRAVNRHVQGASGNGPTRGLNFPLATVALNPASSRPGSPMAATDDDVLLRLALWLAEVAAEATLVATAPGPAAPPVAGSAP